MWSQISVGHTACGSSGYGASECSQPGGPGQPQTRSAVAEFRVQGSRFKVQGSGFKECGGPARVRGVPNRLTVHSQPLAACSDLGPDQGRHPAGVRAGGAIRVKDLRIGPCTKPRNMDVLRQQAG